MVHRAAGRPVSGDEVVAALCAGFSAALNITLQESAFTQDEEARARELLPEYAVLTHTPAISA